jgi:hypothetical protein
MYQGVQIWRIFASGAIVFFGQFYDNYKKQPWVGTYPYWKNIVLHIFTEKRIGLHFWRFVKTHPVTLYGYIMQLVGARR